MPDTKPKVNSTTPQAELMATAQKILRERGEQAMNDFIREESERRLAQKMKEDQLPRNPSPKREPVPDITAGADKLSDSIQKVIQKAPVDKTRAPAVRPESIQDTIKILQPKSVAFGRYQLTEWQENVMTLIMEQLQGYMSKSLSLLKPDLLGEITVRIDTSGVAGDDKKKALAQIEKMMDYKFEFWWQNNLAPHGTKKVETKGIIISTIHNYVGTSYVDLVINKWAIPFLLYYGPGIGASRYRKQIALTLPGKYTKRLYKILSGYIDRGQFDFPIDSLKREFEIPDSYTNAQIKRSIVNPAVKAINDYDPDLRVEAEFTTRGLRKATDKKKPSLDTVHFTIGPKTEQDSGASLPSEDEQEAVCIAFLSPLLEEPYRGRLTAYARQWRLHGDIGFVYAKIRYYEQMMRSGRMTPAKMRNFLLKAISEETGIKLRRQSRRRVQDEQ